MSLCKTCKIKCTCDCPEYQKWIPRPSRLGLFTATMSRGQWIEFLGYKEPEKDFDLLVKKGIIKEVL